MGLLSESRTNIEEFSGRLNFIQRRPETHPKPVVRPDTFVDGSGGDLRQCV